MNGHTQEGRAALLARGFETLLIAGKRPIVPDWTSGEITPERLASWERQHGGMVTGTGLRTGKLAVVDIDLEDEKLAEDIGSAVQGVLGLSDFRRIGAKGFQLAFYNRKPLRKITIAGRLPGDDKPRTLVEFLGQGQQIAAYGLHPDTGKPFTWPEASPLDASLEELPEVTRAELRRAAIVARDRLEEAGVEDVQITGDLSDRPEPREIKSPEELDPITPAMLRNMLAHIDPARGGDHNEWIGWLGVIMEAPLVEEDGTESDFGEGERTALAVEWSAGDLNPEHDPGSYYKGAEYVAEKCKTVGGYSGQRKTLRSLVQEAKENGYAGQTFARTAEEFNAMHPPSMIAAYYRGQGLQVIDGGAARKLDLDEIPDDCEPEETEEVSNRWRSLIYRGEQIARIKPPMPIIPGYLLSRGVTALLAPRRSGKTIVALDLGLSLALNRSWAGEKVATGWYVVYLAGEDHENAAAHVQAWAKVNNGGNVPERFTFVRDVPDLLDRHGGDVTALAEAIGHDLPEGARVLWIVDTWQRATTGGGQNEDGDMKVAFHRLEVLANSHRGAALACFHPPKDNARTISGVAFQENAAVAMLAVEKIEPDKPESERRLTVLNIKGRGEGNFKLFRFREVEVGEPDTYFNQAPVGVVAEHGGGTGESNVQRAAREAREREEADKLAEETLAAVKSLLADGWRILGSNRGGGVGALKPSDVAKRLKARPEKVEEALARLLAEGRLSYREAHGKAKASYVAPE